MPCALERSGALCDAPYEVEVALWFHDAIYQPRRFDNEKRSARWLETVARSVGVSARRAVHLVDLVMATRHAVEPEGNDACVLVDIDLSILGVEPARFDEYEQQIRAEYRWVPDFLYRRKRSEILASFLARARIYSTPEFFQRFEAQARVNLRRSLDQLSR